MNYVVNMGVSRGKVVLLPNGVDTKAFRPISAEDKAELRKRLDLPDEMTIVLFVGRLEFVKGLDVLLHAWSQLPNHIRLRSLLILVGDGAEQNNLKRMSRALGIQETVIMVGERQIVHDYYSAADIFVLPSRSEGMPVALMEAMASGLPVIASNVGGSREVIEHGKNGILFESESYNDLAEKLALITLERCKWSKMGILGRRTGCAPARAAASSSTPPPTLCSKTSGFAR